MAGVPTRGGENPESRSAGRRRRASQAVVARSPSAHSSGPFRPSPRWRPRPRGTRLREEGPRGRSAEERAIDGAHVRATIRRRDDGTVEVDVEIVLERRSSGTDELRGLGRLLATCRSSERLSAHRRIQTNTPGSSSPSDE